MGSSMSQPATNTGSEGSLVVLNVYDLTPVNDYLIWFGLGIYHSGIEVHGLEYGFGAHEYSTSGVFEVEPRNCPGFTYRCSIVLGRTDMDPSEFRTFIEDMAEEYHGDTYHVITKNCNHFTEDTCLRLIGKPVPGWINRLAKLGALCNCLLPDGMRIEQATVKQMSEHSSFSSGDAPDSLSWRLATARHEPPDDEDATEEKHLLSQPPVPEVTLVRETRQ